MYSNKKQEADQYVNELYESIQVLNKSMLTFKI
jgi:hypothetical protein